MFEISNRALWMAGFEVALGALIKAYLAPKPIKQQEIALLCRRLWVHTLGSRLEPNQPGWAWPLPPALGRMERLPSEGCDLK